MATPSSEWDFLYRQSLATPSGVALTSHECLLLDYTLSSYARLIPEWTTEGLMRWERLRGAVWQALDLMNKDDKGVPSLDGSCIIVIPQSEAAILLALVPTTYRWGTGPDVAVPLKLKLSQCLRGVYQMPVEKEVSHASDDPNAD